MASFQCNCTIYIALSTMRSFQSFIEWVEFDIFSRSPSLNHPVALYKLRHSPINADSTWPWKRVLDIGNGIVAVAVLEIGNLKNLFFRKFSRNESL